MMGYPEEVVGQEELPGEEHSAKAMDALRDCCSACRLPR